MSRVRRLMVTWAISDNVYSEDWWGLPRLSGYVCACVWMLLSLLWIVLKHCIGNGTFVLQVGCLLQCCLLIGRHTLLIGDPLLFHASHIVSVRPADQVIDPRKLSAQLRIANSVRKVFVIATASGHLPMTSQSSSVRVGAEEGCVTKDQLRTKQNEVAYTCFRRTVGLLYSRRAV